MADASEMGDWLKFCGVLNPLHQIVGQLTSRTTGAVGHADEIRHVRFQVSNRLVKRLGRGGTFRREKLERKRRRFRPDNVRDMHRRSYLRSFSECRSTEQ